MYLRILVIELRWTPAICIPIDLQDYLQESSNDYEDEDVRNGDGRGENKEEREGESKREGGGDGDCVDEDVGVMRAFFLDGLGEEEQFRSSLASRRRERGFDWDC